VISSGASRWAPWVRCRGWRLVTVPSMTEVVTMRKSEAEIASASTDAAWESKATTRTKPAATTATASIQAFRRQRAGTREGECGGAAAQSAVETAQGAGRRACTHGCRRAQGRRGPRSRISPGSAPATH